MEHKLFFPLAIAIALVITFLAGVSRPAKEPNAGALPGAALGTILTQSSSSVTTASAQVLAGNANRSCAYLVNDAAVDVYLRLGTGSAVAHEGIRLNANGGTLNIGANNRWTGQIQAVTASGTSTLTVVECQ